LTHSVVFSLGFRRQDETKPALSPELVLRPVAAEEVGADAEEDAEEERYRVEDVDDAADVGYGKQQRAGDDHLYCEVSPNHRVCSIAATIDVNKRFFTFLTFFLFFSTFFIFTGIFSPTVNYKAL